MSSKFFNNNSGSTLFDKFKGIAEEMSNFHSFLAVVGYFRSSGYFKLRKELANVQEIKILVGINIDSIFKKHNQALLMLEGDDEAREIYTKDFIQDVKDAQYSPEVEEGIIQLCDDIVSGKLQMRIHKSKNLHAKFYLCLPQHFSPNTDGWVFMGSSNISESGLGITQPPRYELNVAMKDYDDVAYCKNEFETLWSEGLPITAEDIERIRKKTHLEKLPTPYEIFIKVLIDAFGNQVEDNFTMELPKGYMQLKYQRDAVIQGFQMLKEYNGFFLADVVGTGKTIVAAMIAKRFVEENGRGTKILVIYPPSVKDNWRDTFKDFSLIKYTQFVTNGSLNKITEGGDNYDEAEAFDLIIVDEAHNFRTDTSGRYDDLQRICKAPRVNEGLIEGIQKKVILLSATPLNNRPEDFRNLILLFQNARKPTLDGITNITTLFQPWIKKYNELMRKRGRIDNKTITDEVDMIYEDMRTKVLDKILVRRTRKNLWNNEEYKSDLIRQGIHFPNVEQPNECIYQLDDELSELFYNTITILTETPDGENPNGIGLHYARYRAIEFISGDKASNYRNAIQFAQVFSGIFRVHMVKRLESSFYAFKKSLHTFLRITNDMIKMWENNIILIAPEIDVKGMMANDIEFDVIVEKALEHGYDKEDILFTQEDFRPEYITKLREDSEKLEYLTKLWDKIDKDPKYELFKLYLENELMNKVGYRRGKKVELNKEGKLVIFSESVDTINYLGEKLRNELHREDVLVVSASNRKNVLNDIRANFDANYSGEKQNKYNIILSSDVLAEGINLHRSNIIVNYDSPWNATRLMQRIGRVNRIGSTSDHIYNYMFYPSKDGDKQIKLYTNALIKLQGFHSALGEDAQVYSREEMLREFQLFDDKIKDNVDKQLELLREIRELYTRDRDLYNKIKTLPYKSRTVRSAENRPKELNPQTTIVYITTGQRSQFYRVIGNDQPEKIEFLQAAEWLRAKQEEPCGNFEAVKEAHYKHVRKAYVTYENEITAVNTTETSIEEKKKDKNAITALAFLREMKRMFSTDDDIYSKIQVLDEYVNEGMFSNLTLNLNRMSRDLNKQKKTTQINILKPIFSLRLEKLYDHYYISKDRQMGENQYLQSEIITSETFE